MKITGGTIIESIIALLVISICLAIAFKTIVNSEASNSNLSALKCELACDKIISSSLRMKDYSSGEETIDSYTYKKQVSFVNRYEGVLKIRVQAYNENQLLHEVVRYIYTK